MLCKRFAVLLIILMIHIQCTLINAADSGQLNLEQFLQPEQISERDYSNATSCYRPCEQGAPPKICYYKWMLDDYKTMGPACKNCPNVSEDCFREQCVTADGYERGMTSVNHQLGGPSIQVCLGDRIIVDVTNRFLGRSTVIHWHGMHQRGTPYMDGVPMITQCPIPEMTTFRYDFKASNLGTHYWHSHDGFQKQDGIQGSFVVRQPKKTDPHGHLYDLDLATHVVFISDWMRLGAGEHFPGLRSHDRFQEPESILLDGRGLFMGENRSKISLYSVFRVTKGKRYRFRLVGGTCTSCSYHFSIHDHPLLVIATDGCPIEPVQVNSIVLNAGERFDFVLEASRDIKSYFIHLRATGSCGEKKLYTLGVLRYEGDTTAFLNDPGFEGHYDGKAFNVYNANCTSVDGVCVNQMISLSPISPAIRKPKPDFSFTLRYGFHNYTVDRLFRPGEYKHYFPHVSMCTEFSNILYYEACPEKPNEKFLLGSAINNISFQMPNSPILSQREDIGDKNFCPKGYNGMPTCPGNDSCHCVHLIQVPLGGVVQFALVDEGLGSVDHPFHLHGYSFNVIAMGKFKNGEDINTILGRIGTGAQSIPLSPVHKDTIAIPASGYAVIRVVANNPGYWFFHCHILYHADTGMAVIFQVGDHREIPRPPVGFHKCGDYLPPAYNEAQPHKKFPGGNGDYNANKHHLQSMKFQSYGRK